MKNLLLLLAFLPILLHAQKVTLSGYIKDADTGEDLIYATIFAKEANSGTNSNEYGFYSLSLNKGSYTLLINYTGYAQKLIEIDLQKDTAMNISLSGGDILIDSAVVITARRNNANVEDTKMGTIELQMDQIKKLPVLMGEVDVLKTIQLLPGVLSAGEGNAGFFVRGGGSDQNLLLLDEAVVYNAGHLLGFFSIFNSDAIKNTTLIKGGMPANYGGRLSSVVDVQMKDGNKQHYVLEGGIGAIASRLTFQGPIVKDKSSFLISGRRTYVFDVAQPFLKGTNFEGTNYYFYDLNLKANYVISNKDRLFLSGYFGRDVMNLNNPDRGINFKLNWGNATGTVRWNHLFNDKMFMNAMFIFNDYDFLSAGSQDQFSFKLESGVRDWGGKVSFSYYPNPKHKIKFGADYTHHTFTPNIASARSGDEAFIIAPDKKYGQETGVYLLDDWKINSKFSINVGFRASMFQQLGPYSSSLDSTTYRPFQTVKTFWGAEPRFSSKFTVDNFSSLKVGITLGRQYIHLVSNSATTLPTDLWVPSSELVKPQWGTQYAFGYFRNFLNDMLEASVEVYYKDLYNQLDYSEYFTQNIDTEVENEFVSGRGYAYGAEFFLRKQKGNLTGWISYTLSRSLRNFEAILGNIYPTRFDRLHNLAVVASYDYKKWNFSATFVYGTGAPYTPIRSLYMVGFTPITEYGFRNSARLPDYHRADLSISYDLSKKSKNFESVLVLSAYNVYNRRNVFFTYTVPESDARSGTVALKSYKVSLFPIIPALTWNFKWNIKKNQR
jgi:hypothetical protein